MQIPISLDNIAFFEALASDARLKIIQILAGGDFNIKELAEKIGISSPIMIKHIQKLEDVGLVTTRHIKRNGSTHKMCTLTFAEYILTPPLRSRGMPTIYKYSVPVGHYSRIEGVPTCGLATEIGVIGIRDDPHVFFEADRVNAQLLWFTHGFVEYCIPNYLTPDQTATEIEISLEISSEAPDFLEDWPSDIKFYFNGILLFTWTSPGDFGMKRGIYTPEWWVSNQYGLLKTLHITPDGVMMDNDKVSDVTLSDVLHGGDYQWVLRLEVDKNVEHVGGLTLYGKNFGNYAQDIIVRTFFIINDDSQY